MLWACAWESMWAAHSQHTWWPLKSQSTSPPTPSFRFQCVVVVFDTSILLLLLLLLLCTPQIRHDFSSCWLLLVVVCELAREQSARHDPVLAGHPVLRCALGMEPCGSVNPADITFTPPVVPGLDVMGDSMSPLRSYQPFVNMLVQYIAVKSSPLPGLLSLAWFRET